MDLSSAFAGVALMFSVANFIEIQKIKQILKSNSANLKGMDGK